MREFEGIPLQALSERAMDMMDDIHSFIPHNTRGCIVRYIECGIMPGGFIHALLCNDLKETFARADINNTKHLKTIVCWLYNSAPGNCWGSPEIVHEWMKRRHPN